MEKQKQDDFQNALNIDEWNKLCTKLYTAKNHLLVRF